ncbi:MAG: GIY-YIG nuclease family protein [Christensenellales bacterium]
MVDIEKKINEGRELAERLMSTTALYFGKMKPLDIPENIAGVYVIFDKETGETLYVGRTKNLRRRLYTNHLHGPKTNARLKKYLVEDERQRSIVDMDKAKEYLKNNCYVKFIVESDTVRRGQIEGLLSFLLNVRYIDEEH